jgi:hypothetical protein
MLCVLNLRHALLHVVSMSEEIKAENVLSVVILSANMLIIILQKSVVMLSVPNLSILW